MGTTIIRGILEKPYIGMQIKISPICSFSESEPPKPEAALVLWYDEPVTI
jgi:hypothetical protein